MDKIKILIFLFLFSKTLSAQIASFYFSPHQDDFFLFMGNNISKDYKNDSAKISCIFITNGDAAAKNYSYTVARNEGSKEAIRFTVDQLSSSKRIDINDTLIVNSHKIERYRFRDFTAYYLNLPCGLVSDKIDVVPLGKFKNGTLDSIQSTNKIATYKSWADLKNTIDTLIVNQSIGMKKVYVNSLDYDTKIDMYDHPDHNIIGSLVSDLSSHQLNWLVRYYIGYSIENKLSNIDVEDIAQKAGMFASYDYTMRIYDNLGKSTWDFAHTAWISRSYYRTEDFTNNIPTAVDSNHISVYSKDGILYINALSSINGTIQIYDLLGKCLLQAKLTEIGWNTVDLGNLKRNSIYLYKINGNKKIAGKFIFIN